MSGTIRVMQAAVCTAYGPPEVLQVRDVPRPSPKQREILVKVHATSVTVSDTYGRSGFDFARWWQRFLVRLAFGYKRPRNPILGIVLAGQVEQAGKGVTRFRPGDRVYGLTGMRSGTYAQYMCVKETSAIAASPANLSDDEAAAIPYGGLIALYFLTRAGLRSGQRVLVYGASGAIGTAALQIAKIAGAHVTAVCGPTNLDLVTSLGADVAIDYTREDAPRPGGQLDLVFDAVGRRKTSAFKVASATALTPGGKYASVDDPYPRLTAALLAQLTAWAESGRLRPVIDRRYPLAQIAEAHRYVEQRHKKGNVIITIPHDG
jgi:NADPH:quinone reductase-like Zn-dependent oxidoreductase